MPKSKEKFALLLLVEKSAMISIFCLLLQVRVGVLSKWQMDYMVKLLRMAVDLLIGFVKVTGNCATVASENLLEGITAGEVNLDQILNARCILNLREITLLASEEEEEGGVGSKGGTHCNYNGTKIARGEDCKYDGSNVMTEGGSQISPLDELPYGGYVDRYEKNEDYEMSSGGTGGFGAGGQGGATCHGFSKELDTAFDGGKNQWCYIYEFPFRGYYGAGTCGAG